MAQFDIVIPCYNYGRFLEGCARSALDQPGQNVRVLIIDDASSDDSVQVARTLAAGDPRISVIAHERNRGHIATYNEGIAWAERDYCLLLSADDLLAPGALERAAAVMDSDPDVGLTYGDCAVWMRGAPPPSIAAAANWGWSHCDLLQELCQIASNFVPTPTAIARTCVQKAVGFYHASLPHSGDLEMWLRFAARARVARIDAIQAIYRKHADAMSNAYVADMVRDYRQRRAAFDSFFAKCGDGLADLPSLRREVARALADQSFQSGVDALRRGQFESGLRLLRWASGQDRRLRYVPPLWRLLRLPGPEGRRRILSALGKGFSSSTGETRP